MNVEDLGFVGGAFFFIESLVLIFLINVYFIIYFILCFLKVFCYFLFFYLGNSNYGIEDN